MCVRYGYCICVSVLYAWWAPPQRKLLYGHAVCTHTARNREFVERIESIIYARSHTKLWPTYNMCVCVCLLSVFAQDCAPCASVPELILCMSDVSRWVCGCVSACACVYQSLWCSNQTEPETPFRDPNAQVPHTGAHPSIQLLSLPDIFTIPRRRHIVWRARCAPR